MADHVPKLGALIAGAEERDAIHVAVVPVTAGCPLAPGEHVCVTAGVANPAARGEGIGVVDPFLVEDVKRGQQFWLCLYPGTVISLRHVYRHPVLDAQQIRQETIEMLHSDEVAYLKECASIVGMDYADFMTRARMYVEKGETHTVDMDTSNASIDIDWPKMWRCYAAVTGTQVTEKDDFFVCSC